MPPPSSPCTLTVTPSQVESALADYLASQDPNHVWTRRWAEYHHALPLVVDMSGCVALRPDGTLIQFAWDAEADISVRVDSHTCHVARAIGARKYPSINGLAPAKGPTARTCEACGGTGTPIEGNPLSIIGSICICGNTGWLPE
jgi:hypothetical protein